MLNDFLTLVIDNGSGMHKAGFSGEEYPRSVFQTVVGLPKHFLGVAGCKTKDIYIGDEINAKRGVLSLKYPIEHGIIKNLNDIEEIWNYTFNKELRVDPSDHPVMLTDSIRNPKANREMMTQIMFETFNVKGLYIGLQCFLSIYASGRSTGLICDIGDGVSEVIPFYDGYYLSHASMRQNLAGRDLNDYMETLLNERGYYFSTSEGKEIVREIKEYHSYVALNYDEEIKKSECELEVTHNLPNGNAIQIYDERFRCPELLFKPYKNGFELNGIDKMIFNSIIKCDINTQKYLYSNICLSGGSTMFEGFCERVEKEITNLAPPSMKVKIVAPPERKYAVWTGGSILGSLSTFSQALLSNDEYREYGPKLIHQKFF